MARTSGRSGGQENSQHFHAIRMRLTGSGNLQMDLFSLDNVRTQGLVDFVMTPTTNREPTRLCNFTEQKAYLEIKTTLIDETFLISKIIVFVKPISTGEFPSVA